MAPTAPAPGGKTAQAPVLAPFRAGTQPTYKPSGFTQTNALGSSSIELPDYQIGPTNLLRGIDIEVSAVGVNATNSVAFGGDMPLGVLSTVNFQDSGGNCDHRQFRQLHAGHDHEVRRVLRRHPGRPP